MMAGLLDLNDPQSMGLLSIGLRLMSTPGKFGAALGTAGMGALGDMQQAQARQQSAKQMDAAERMRALQEQMTMLQLAQAKQQQAAQGKRESYLGSVSPSQGPAMPVDMAQALAAGLSPQEASALMPQKPQGADYKVVGGSLLQIGPDGVKEAFRAPQAPQKQDLDALIVPGPDGKPMINQLALQARRMLAEAGRVPAATAPATPAPPKLSAAAEKVEIERTKAGQQAQQMLAAIGQAKSLLGSNPTESGIGAGVDWLGRQVGVSSESSKKAAQLETLSGWMVANVPRMEGPQSNFDILNYQTMAAKVGDRTVPVDERLAALQTLEQLHRKYAEINGTPLPAPAAPKLDTKSLFQQADQIIGR